MLSQIVVGNFCPQFTFNHYHNNTSKGVCSCVILEGGTGALHHYVKIPSKEKLTSLLIEVKHSHYSK